MSFGKVLSGLALVFWAYFVIDYTPDRIWFMIKQVPTFGAFLAFAAYLTLGFVTNAFFGFVIARPMHKILSALTILISAGQIANTVAEGVAGRDEIESVLAYSLILLNCVWTFLDRPAAEPKPQYLLVV